MNVTVRTAVDFVKRLGYGDLGRKTLEALALRSSHAGRLTACGLRSVLGFTTQAGLGP